ncbi:MAG: hypothetical protein WBC04_09320 [Candidatus Acidiferrales bacterium]
MRKIVWLSATLFFLASVAVEAQQQDQSSAPPAPQAQAEKPESQQPKDALAEAARKAREQKKSESKAPKVWDNDNIPATPGAVSVAGGTSASSGTATVSTSPSSTAAMNDQEKLWRQRFAQARAKLQSDQAKLDLLNREYGQLSTQFYTDPVKGMQQGFTQGDLTKKRAAIDAMQKQVQADQQAISDLEDELRKAGGDPGWARE